MGLFTYLKIEHPDYPHLHGIECQTKNDIFEPHFMDTAVIDADGRLHIPTHEYGVNNELPPGEIAGFIVRTHEEWKPYPYHGDLAFVTAEEGWPRYVARFDDGVLRSINQMEVTA